MKEAKTNDRVMSEDVKVGRRGGVLVPIDISKFNDQPEEKETQEHQTPEKKT